MHGPLVEATAQLVKSRRGGYGDVRSSGRYSGCPEMETGSAYPAATAAAVRKRPLSLLKSLLLAQVVASRPSLWVLSSVKDRQKYMSPVESPHVCEAYPSWRFCNTTRGN